ncbi:receptor-type tyrosine-protein phosphatase eta-like [Rhinophrynus dorsalis]
MNQTSDSVSLIWDQPDEYKSNYTYKVESNSSISMIQTSESATVTGLIPGYTYTFTVTTRTADNVTGDAQSVITCTVPGQAQNINVNNQNSTSFLEVSWTKPEGKVDYYNVTLGGSISITNQTNSTQMNFTDLLPGTLYTISIQTISGNCSQSAGSVSEATYPTKPGDIIFTNIGTSNLSLSWEDPINMNSVTKTFTITYSNSSGSWNVSSSTRNVTLPYLRSGTKYTITVVTVAARMYQSSPVTTEQYTKPFPVKRLQVSDVNSTSAFLIWDKPDEYNIPGQAQNINVNNQNSTSFLEVSWTKPEGKVDYYNVTLGGSISITNQTNSTQMNFTDLLPGTLYTISIQTISGNCSQSAGSVSEATYPTKPGDIIFTNIGTSNLSLSWEDPINMNSVTKTFTITYSNSSGSWNVSSSTRNVTLPYLRSGTKYTITVVTVAARMYQSSPVTTEQYTKPFPVKRLQVSDVNSTSAFLIWDKPDEYNIPGQAQNINVNNQNSTSFLEVSWTKPEGKVDYYNVTLGGSISITNQTNSTQMNFTDLRPGTLYTISIQTISGNCSQSAGSVSEATYPTKPGDIIFTNIGTSNLSLSWEDPINMNSVTKTFTITYSNSSGSWNVSSSTRNVTLPYLRSGTKYTITVVTVAARMYQSSPVTTEQYTNPGQAQNIKVNNQNSTSFLEVSWTKPEGKVDYYNVTLGGSISITNQTNSTQMNFTDLLPGTLYTISIQTISSFCIQSAGSVSEATYPTKPGDIIFTNIGTSNLSLSWEDPINMTNVTKTFTITYINSSGSWNVSSSTRNITLQNLRSGTKYTISVVTVGARMYQSSPVTTEQYTNPTKPGDIIFTSNGTSNLSLSWGDPINMNSVTKTFTIIYSNSSGFWNVSRNTTNVTIPYLRSGTKYTITVVTVAARLYQSSPVTTEQYTRPYPVRNLKISSTTSTTVSLTWDHPEEYNSSYTYKVETNNSLSTVETNNASTVTGLTPGETYIFTVTARAADNVTVSDSISVITCTVPGFLGSQNIAVNNKNSTNFLEVSWTKPDGTVDHYNVFLSGTPNKTITTSSIETNFTELLPGTEYSISIEVISGNCSQTSGSVSEATYPTKPGDIIFTNNGTSNLSLSWEDPINMTNVTKTFTITYINSSGSWNVSSNTTNVTLQYLRSGTKYTISVVTVGARMYQSSPVTTEQYTNPTKPGDIIFTNIGTNSLSLSWGDPINMNSVTKTFTITYSNSSSSWNVSSNTTNVTLQYLRSGTKYTITVVTVGARMYQSSPVTTEQYTNPTKPGDIIFTNIGTNSLSLSWEDPINMNSVTKTFTITYSNSSGSWNVSSSTRNVTLQYLRSGTKYTISVVTVGARMYQSSPVTTEQYTIPGQAQSIKVTNQNSTSFLEVSWTKPEGKVDYYNVTLGGSIKITTSTQLNFTDLLPGTLYTISIQTISSFCIQSAGSVSEATYPTKPGDIIFTNIGTNSLSLSWGDPINMNSVTKTFTITYSNSSGSWNVSNPTKPGDIIFTNNGTNNLSLSWEDPINMTNVTKTFTITYSNSSGSWNVSSNTTNVTLPYLRSGTKYTITVVTVGARMYQSSPVTTEQYTIPGQAQNINVTNQNSTSFLEVSWTKPEGKVDYYNVTLGGSIKITTSTQLNFTGLLPGTLYTISIQTISSFCIQSAGSVSEATYPTKPGDIIFTNIGTNSLSLSWGDPINMNSVTKTFTITYSNSSGSWNVSSNTTNVTLPYLRSGTKYTISVVTVGARMYQSSPVTTEQYTIPVPPTVLPTPDSSSLKHNQISFTFPEFDSSNGPIKAYAAIVTTGSDGARPPPGVLSMTYRDYKNKNKDTYVALIKETGLRSVRSDTPKSITVQIGDGSSTHGYENGPLSPMTSYRVSIAGFTAIHFDNTTNIIAEGSCRFTYMNYSNAFVTQQDPGVIIGAVVGCILGTAVICVLGFFIWRKRRRVKTSQPIKTANFESHFMRQKADSNLGFSTEYESFASVGTDQPKEAAEYPENKIKNRYTNVLPYDHSRVKLLIQDHPTDDYINANYIPGFNMKKEFIAAQGPLPATVQDFWRMIWEKNICVVVMLTRCVELGKVKCEEYWPTEQAKEFGDLLVHLTNETVLPDWTVRDFKVINKLSNENQQVRQYHFTAWPDHGVPKTTDVLINFRNTLWDYVKMCPPNSPVLVHCSAGVGRTGTLIALDRIIKQIECEEIVDVYGIVYDLRMHRVIMVQTESQYIFLNQCALDFIRARAAAKPDLIYQNANAIYENIRPSLRSTKTSV